MRKYLIIILLFLSTIGLNAQSLGMFASSSSPSGTNSAQNLLLWSEQLENGSWDRGTNGTVGVNQALDLTGGNTLELFTLGAAWMGISQIITGLTPSTTYSVSFDIKKGSQGTYYNFSAYDVTHGWATLNDDDYSGSISTTLTRLTFNVTTPAGTTSISISPYIGQSIGDNVYIGRVQLSLPGRPYVTTTNSAVFTSIDNATLTVDDVMITIDSNIASVDNN